MLPHDMLRRRRRRRRERVRAMSGWSLNRLIPNILTLAALCAGMTAIRLAFAEHFEAAVTAIIIAGVFDGLDGRIARLLKGMSSFGAQLDSLSDFVSFGVAPAVLLYLWTMGAMQSVGWALVLLFAVCCALRLARFNTQIGADLPPYAYNFFTGVPAPGGAGLVMLPMMLWFGFGLEVFRSPILNGIVIAVVAALMVSPVPTVSIKRFRVPKAWVLPTLLAFGRAAAVLTTAPWATLLVVGGVYVASIPIGIVQFSRLRRRAELRGATREIAPPQSEPGPDEPPYSAPERG
jgi:CDP-diacylglycerol---serine O-phosphatidyltransferase